MQAYAMQIRLAMLLKLIYLLGRLKIEVALILKEGASVTKLNFGAFGRPNLHLATLCMKNGFHRREGIRNVGLHQLMYVILKL